MLLGGALRLVRSEIRRSLARSQEPAPLPSPTEGAPIIRALVALGDDDPNQQALELTRTLLNTPRIGGWTWWSGTRIPTGKLQSLAARTRAAGNRPEMRRSPPASRLSFSPDRRQLVVAGIGVVGIPQLVIVQNESHWPTPALEEEGLRHLPGWYGQRLDLDHPPGGLRTC